MQLDRIQAALAEAGLDGWLFYDHHHRDPIAYRVLGLSPTLHVSRRWFYFIPAQGTPRKLVHRIESHHLDPLPGSVRAYSTWQELEAGLAELLTGATRIAMQYSPRNAIIYVSMVDAGTVEVLCELGKTIVSSADLVSRFEAVLTPAQEASHRAAQQAIDPILDEGFREIGRLVRSGAAVTEHSMVQWFQRELEAAGLAWDHGPNVSVNANAADSHYEPSAERHSPIRSGDFLLIDIWGRPQNAAPEATCFYDITWTGVIDREPTAEEQSVFTAVRDARDAAIQVVQQAFAAGRPIAGWEADEAARQLLRERGYADHFTHRTGHNIGVELHGSGAHLDNFETHDERLLLPHTCFSVEPGVYLDTFGLRSEVNMLTTEHSAEVTGRVQTELVRV